MVSASFGPDTTRCRLIVQDDVSIDFQSLMLAAKPEGIQENVEIGLAGEEGNPLDHSAGEEVRGVRLSNGIAGSHGARKLMR
jgi:hypothetical protein